MHAYGVFWPVESIAGVFGRVGCIFRTVWGHQTSYFRFVRTLEWLLFKMILVLSELYTYGCEI